MHRHFKVKDKDFIHAGEASSEVKHLLKQIGIPSDKIRKLAIAMYEAEMNIVLHANGGDIDVSISPEQIHVKLADTGPGIVDIHQAMQEGYSTATQEVRELGFGAGMGLPNMKRYSDALNITSEVDKGTTVEIIVLLEKH